MEKEQRLTRAKDFAAVYLKGKSWGNRLLVLKALPNSREQTRFGFSVSRRLGKAVVRNSVKRRMREASRSLPLEVGWDLVVIARGPAAEADFHRLQQAMRDLAARAGLIQAERRAS